MPGLNYNHLRYFWAVAHEGNLTRTAEQLNVAPSALSVQIAKLEDQLGHALFDRRGKQLMLTEAGHIALDHADAIFATGNELLGTLGVHSGSIRAVLQVGALATLSRNFQMEFLKPLLDRDDVELVMRSGGVSELLAGLEAHRLDVVLMNAPPARDGAAHWIAHAIADQPVSLVGTPARVANETDLATLLARSPLIVPTIESSIRQGFDALMDRLHLRPQFAAEVDDMAMLRLFARADRGLAVVPPIVVAEELANGELVEAVQLPEIREHFYALTLRRRFPNPLLRELLAAES